MLACLLVHLEGSIGYAAKTEIAWFGSCANLNKVSGSDLCLPVGSNVIKPREVVRDLAYRPTLTVS